MSEEQLAALLAKLKEDTDLRKKLQAASDLDAAVAMAQEAGFDVSVQEWMQFHSSQVTELSDEELDGVAGGGEFTGSWNPCARACGYTQMCKV